MAVILVGALAPVGARAQPTQPPAPSASSAPSAGSAPSTPAARSCTADAPASAEGVCPLLAGTKVPDARVRTIGGAATSLAAELAGQPAVLVFYRGGWCPFCNVQLGSLQSIVPELQQLGYRIVGVSPDRPAKLKAAIEKRALTFTLLSDSSMCAARALGIAFKVDEATVERYRSNKLDLEGDSGETHHLLPVPSVYLVDADGTIRFAYTNANYRVRLPPEVLLAAAKASTWQVQPKKPL